MEVGALDSQNMLNVLSRVILKHKHYNTDLILKSIPGLIVRYLKNNVDLDDDFTQKCYHTFFDSNKHAESTVDFTYGATNGVAWCKQTGEREKL